MVNQENQFINVICFRSFQAFHFDPIHLIEPNTKHDSPQNIIYSKTGGGVPLWKAAHSKGGQTKAEQVAKLPNLHTAQIDTPPNLDSSQEPK